MIYTSGDVVIVVVFALIAVGLLLALGLLTRWARHELRAVHASFRVLERRVDHVERALTQAGIPLPPLL